MSPIKDIELTRRKFAQMIGAGIALPFVKISPNNTLTENVDAKIIPDKQIVEKRSTHNHLGKYSKLSIDGEIIPIYNDKFSLNTYITFKSSDGSQMVANEIIATEKDGKLVFYTKNMIDINVLSNKLYRLIYMPNHSRNTFQMDGYIVSCSHCIDVDSGLYSIVDIEITSEPVIL